MRQSLFDDLARTLSEPMPRRRVLRLLGGIVVAAAVPGARAAAGVSPRRPVGASQLCKSGSTLCQGFKPTLYTCCGGSEPVCCAKPSAVLCCKSGCQCGTDERGYPECVKCPRCPTGLTECGQYGCCPRGTYCAASKPRILCCKRNEAGCGTRCCAPGLRCINPKEGTCGNCPKGKEPCGKKCCSKSTYCCDPKKGLCCDKKKDGCCNVGDPGRSKWICCREPNECRTQADETGTYPRGAPTTCCPPERTLKRTCCPPGYVSLGGKLVVPPGNLGGLCCRKDKACGSGDDILCCSTGSTLAPELEQICCGGTCVSFKLDAKNCGRCGNVCAPGTSCVNGACK